MRDVVTLPSIRQIKVDNYRLMLNKLNGLSELSGSLKISGSNHSGKTLLSRFLQSIFESYLEIKLKQEINWQLPYSSNLIPEFKKDVQHARLLEPDIKFNNLFWRIQPVILVQDECILLVDDFEPVLHSLVLRNTIRVEQNDKLQAKFFFSLADAIRYIKKRLRSLIKKWIVRWRRDLRNVYTTILRFHFKSMDDCSHHEILFLSAYQATVFFKHLNNHLHEKAGNYRPASGYT